MCRKEVKMRMSHVAKEVHFKNEWRKKKENKIVTLLEILLEAATCRPLYLPTPGALWKTFQYLLWMSRDCFRNLEL